MPWFYSGILWKKVFGQTDPTVSLVSVSSDFGEYGSVKYFFYKIVVSNGFRNAEFFVQSSDFTVKQMRPNMMLFAFLSKKTVIACN